MSAHLARTERQALADLLEQIGPDEPTLCAGWDTGDLLAHLLTRDRRADAAAGMFVKPLAGHLKSVMAQYSAKPWSEQLALLRSGPPAWNPMGWGRLDELTNGSEFYIHHEDVRRGSPGWEPRALDQQTAAALDGMVRSPALRLMARRMPAGVTAVLPDGSDVVLKAEPKAGSGSELGVLKIEGEPGEILLWMSGRDACRVRLDGDDATVAAVTAARGGL